MKVGGKEYAEVGAEAALSTPSVSTWQECLGGGKELKVHCLLAGLFVTSTAVSALASQPPRALAAPGLDPAVLELALRAADAARAALVVAKPELLTVIDYSLPSTEPRFWVLDRTTGVVHWHELVAHGSGTGENLASHVLFEPFRQQAVEPRALLDRGELPGAQRRVAASAGPRAGDQRSGARARHRDPRRAVRQPRFHQGPRTSRPQLGLPGLAARSGAQRDRSHPGRLARPHLLSERVLASAFSLSRGRGRPLGEGW